MQYFKSSERKLFSRCDVSVLKGVTTGCNPHGKKTNYHRDATRVKTLYRYLLFALLNAMLSLMDPVVLVVPDWEWNTFSNFSLSHWLRLLMLLLHQRTFSSPLLATIKQKVKRKVSHSVCCSAGLFRALKWTSLRRKKKKRIKLRFCGRRRNGFFEVDFLVAPERNFRSLFLRRSLIPYRVSNFKISLAVMKEWRVKEYKWHKIKSLSTHMDSEYR